MDSPDRPSDRRRARRGGLAGALKPAAQELTTALADARRRADPRRRRAERAEALAPPRPDPEPSADPVWTPTTRAKREAPAPRARACRRAPDHRQAAGSAAGRLAAPARAHRRPAKPRARWPAAPEGAGQDRLHAGHRRARGGRRRGRAGAGAPDRSRQRRRLGEPAGPRRRPADAGRVLARAAGRGARRRRHPSRASPAGSRSPPRVSRPRSRPWASARAGSWCRTSVAPAGAAAGRGRARPGRAVIVGHLDTERGPGLFARVPALRAPGVAITDRARTPVPLPGGRHGAGAQGPFPTGDVYGGAGASGAGAGHLRRALHRGPGLPRQRPGVRAGGCPDSPPRGIVTAVKPPTASHSPAEPPRWTSWRSTTCAPPPMPRSRRTRRARSPTAPRPATSRWSSGSRSARSVAPEQVIATNGSMQADAFLFSALVAGRPGGGRGPQLRPHAARAAPAGRRVPGHPAGGRRHRRRRAGERARGRGPAEAGAHHPQLPQPGRLHALAARSGRSWWRWPSSTTSSCSRTTRTWSCASRASPSPTMLSLDSSTTWSTRRRSRRRCAPASGWATWPARRS